jgi:uncharacterized membrane protein
MTKSQSALSAFSLVSACSALGALALAAGQAHAGPAAQPEAAQKCYGVAKAGHNDCAAGAHSCAGQAVKSMDGASFVLLPAGDCAKLAGGSLTPR